MSETKFGSSQHPCLDPAVSNFSIQALQNFFNGFGKHPSDHAKRLETLPRQI